MNFLAHFFDIFLDAAPWLMGGLVIAGLIHSFVPTQALAKHLGQDNLISNIKAAVFGAPLPLCSCSVIPAAISLRRNGASRSSTVSFLVSTPETGVDSIAVSYALLGPFMAIVRPIAAVMSAVSAGLITIALPEKSITESPAPAQPSSRPETNKAQTSGCCSSKQTAAPQPEQSDKTSCCASKNTVAVQTEVKAQSEVKTESCCSSQNKAEPKPADSCCSSKQETSNKSSFVDKFISGQKYAFVDIFNDMAGWLLVGLVLAAATLTWLPEDFLTRWGGGFIAMVVMALVGIPMYICATASTPIAAGLLMTGISPGAVLVFLLAGPATNMATIGVVNRELGRNAVIAYLSGVLGVAFIAGFITNWLVGALEIDIQAQLAASQHLLPEWLMYLSAALLALMIIRYAKQQLAPKAEAGCCN
jgi:uncharacterized membrane protein YraQ (UPF0718 family)